MKKIIRILFLICLFSVIFTSFISCDRKYDEGVVLSEAERLIKKSELIEDILFGKGFETVEDAPGYKKVKAESISLYAEQMGEDFTTLQGFKNVISAVYTEGYANDIFSGVLYGTKDSHTRYYQDGEFIMADTTFEERKKDSIEYHYETLKVSDVNGQKITVSIDITITNKDGKTSKRSIEVDMLEEVSGWKLDNPTFAVYDENYDKYKELEEELNKK